MNRLVSLVPVLALLVPATVLAHPGHEASGFGSGVLHPLAGLDHLLAMLGVGLWAAQQRSARGTAALAGAFVLALLAGYLLGLGQGAVAAVELGILGSVLIVGTLVALDRRLPTRVAVGLAAAFALLHGHAHGVEFAGHSAAAFGAGFLLASAALIALGWGASRLAHRTPVPLTRAAGAAIALAGGLLAVLA